MTTATPWIGSDYRRGLRLIGLPFGYSLLLLAAPLLLIFLLGFWTQDYLYLTAASNSTTTSKHGRIRFIGC